MEEDLGGSLKRVKHEVNMECCLRKINGHESRVRLIVSDVCFVV